MGNITAIPFEVRPATPAAAAVASPLIYLSMGELADYLFGGARRSVDEILAGLFLREGNRFSRSIADLAEWHGQPAGMLVSFPGSELTRRESAIRLGLLKLCGLWDVLRLSLPALSIANGRVVLTKTYPGPAENAHAGYHRMVKEVN